MKKMNVLFIIPSLRLGGAERQVIDLANGLAEKNLSIYLFTFEHDLSLIESLHRDCMTFYNYPRRYKLDFSPCRELARIIREHEIDIIHCTLQIALLYGLLGRMFSGRRPKVLCTVHTTINRNFKYELFDRLLYVPLMKFCDGIIAVCENQRKYWVSRYPFLRKRIVTIHNGIDTEKYKDHWTLDDKRALKVSLGIDEGEKVVGMVAGLRMEKGHEFALGALKLLMQSDDRVKLLIVGDGDRKVYLQSLANELDISKQIIWLGKIQDPRPYIGIFDIFLMASYAVETFSLAILEALSMGKPVVATDVGGTSEMVLDGVNGFLVKPRDPEEIGQKLHYLMENYQSFYQMTLMARNSVTERFRKELMVMKTEEFFNQILKKEYDNRVST